MKYIVNEAGIITEPDVEVISANGGEIEIRYAKTQEGFFACLSVMAYDKGYGSGLSFELHNRYESMDSFLEKKKPELVEYFEENEKNRPILNEFLDYLKRRKQVSLF